MPTTKDEHPVADVGIIDGHIQIMGAYNAVSWEQFIETQFLRPIARLFDQKCKIVVLLFDNRFAVSPYKGMTQHKRCDRFKEIKFSAGDSLPRQIPSPLMDYMMNRYFKDKVISMVCERIQQGTQPSPERTLIVDFKGAPKLYQSAVDCPVDIPFLHELGESDIKYARWVHMLGNSIVYATDGDYIPIALLYYGRHGLRENNKIYIYRQEANISAFVKTPRGAPPPKKNAPKKKKTMEYIDMQQTFKAVLHLMRAPQCDAPVQQLIVGFVSLMLLCGTDYSRSLPLVGPKRIIDMVPMLHSKIVQSAVPHEDGSTFLPSPHAMMHKLATAIYQRGFPGNVFPTARVDSMHAVLSVLQKSSLSHRNKSLLPSPPQVETTCRNVAW